jgi:hypothetical protein
VPHLFQRGVGDLPVEPRDAGVVRKLEQRPDRLERDALIGRVEVLDELLQYRVQLGIATWAYDAAGRTRRALRSHG